VKVETRIANHHNVKEGENHKVKFFSSKVVWKAMVDKDCSGAERGSIQQHTYQGFNTSESDQITSQ
jgi:hypothetical protein